MSRGLIPIRPQPLIATYGMKIATSREGQAAKLMVTEDSIPMLGDCPLASID